MVAPSGKNIINIAAYGGYALWLFHDGARRVTSVDISENAIRVNRLLKSTISQFDFRTNQRVMSGQITQAEVETLSALTQTTERYVRRYFSEVAVNGRNSSNNFPQLRDERSFSIIKNAMETQGSWRICRAELIDFLEQEPDQSADTIYASTVRNWVLEDYEALDKSVARQRWSEEFDARLARAAHACLKLGGSFIDMRIGAPYECPKVPLDFATSWSMFDHLALSEHLKHASVAIKR